MKKKLNTKSVILSWTASYLLVLIIPVVIFFYGSMATGKVVRNEVSNVNRLILDSMQETLDSHLELMKNTYQFVFSNSAFKKMSTSPGNDGIYHNAYELMRILSGYSTSNNNIGITVYLKDKDYIVSDKTANFTSTLYYAQCMLGMDMPYADWKSLLSKKYSSAFFLAPGFEIGAYAKCLVYGHTIRISSEEINIFITLPVSVISDYSRTVDGGSVMIADSEGAVIDTFGDNPAFLKLDFTRAPGELAVGKDGKSYVITYSASTQHRWYYAIATPAANYWFALRRTTYFHISAVAVSICLGAVAVWLLLKRNYRPLGKIAKTLHGYGTYKNEFDLITHSCNLLINENSNMRTTLDVQSNQLRERYLLYLLKGRTLNYSEKSIKSYCQIDGLNENLCLVAFSVGMPSEDVIKAYCDELEYENTILFSIDNVFNDLMKSYSYYKIEDGRTLLYLLHLDCRQLEQWDREKVSLMTFIYDFLNERLSVPVSCVISKTMNELETIRYLYLDVMAALDYKNITGEAGVMLTDAHKARTEAYKIYNGDQWVQDLARAVKGGSMDQCGLIIHRICNEYSQNSSMPLMVFRMAMNHCLYTVLNAYCEIITDNELRHRLVTDMIPLMTAENVKAMHEGLLGVIDFACHTINNQKESTNGVLARKVQCYIQEKYADSNLNVSTVSDAFNKNPNYLSQVFCQQTGESILDYIRNVRIQHAKKLMSDPGLTIDNVSKLVGFTNTKTFRRSFHRVTGLQPNQYGRGAFSVEPHHSSPTSS